MLKITSVWISVPSLCRSPSSERWVEATLMKESDDQRFEPRGSPPFVIFVRLPFIRLCGDAVISADAAGTAASQSEQQQHIETSSRGCLSPFVSRLCNEGILQRGGSISGINKLNDVYFWRNPNATSPFWSIFALQRKLLLQCCIMVAFSTSLIADKWGRAGDFFRFDHTAVAS